MTANQVKQSGSNDPTLVAPAPAPEMRRLSDPDRGLLTKRQLGPLIQKSQRTVDNWCARGLLPHIKLPGKRGAVLFDWQAVKAALDRFTVK